MKQDHLSINDIGQPDENGIHPDDAPHLDPESTDVPTTARRRRPVPLRKELPLLIWLVGVWLALSRDLSVMNIVFSVLIVWVVTHVFRLPPVELAGRFNPFKALVMVGSLTWQSLIASIRVFHLAVTEGPRARSSIIKVQLVTHDDLVLTAVSHALAIVPGSIVCEVDRDAAILYVHVLGVSTDEAADDFIREAHETEYRILDILGRQDERERAAARRLSARGPHGRQRARTHDTVSSSGASAAQGGTR
ncbi:Na+/H+ antiporter subunit E [Falsarthrobacter nasiphocae]|uniref:Multicomponent Na+:H+ antiporter subunit E n=1 Tax=Falsarthrobacter nasiphocae TaxID=189863 RepID=A0AAE3YI04_9MICC|nr:Na+/H+ antiporter subunit E [Falsarthrobacter nasiphocae]MDR6892288.1 multicomponent Na+:H+ antiporter subunit E [Falsarthrobacter nasiphocae]